MVDTDVVVDMVVAEQEDMVLEDMDAAAELADTDVEVLDVVPVDKSEADMELLFAAEHLGEFRYESELVIQNSHWLKHQ